MPLSIENLTFGVEIECYLPRGFSRQDLGAALAAAGVSHSVETYNHTTRGSWKIITDGSLGDYERGTEVVSPVLRGSDGEAQVAAVCAVLQQVGATVNRSCGLHVHVGVESNDRTCDLFKHLVNLYSAAEAVIDTFVAPSRRSNNTYCHRVGSVGPVLQADDLDSVRRYYGPSRYRKLNLEAFWRHGTVEFRQHQGTVDARKITEWSRLCRHMVALAVERASAAQPTVVTGAATVFTSHFPSYAAVRVVRPNPHRAGTNRAARFNQIDDGMTVSDFRRYIRWPGQPMRWLENYVSAGHLRVEDRPAPRAISLPVTPAEPLASSDGLFQLLEVPPATAAFLRERARVLA